MLRRDFIQTMAVLTAGELLQAKGVFAIANDKNTWRMPDEADPHKRTWMAFGASKQVWGSKLLAEVQRNLATIALTIAKYQPVSMW